MYTGSYAKSQNAEIPMDRILIIEDDALIGEELATLLSNQGYTASCVPEIGEIGRAHV